MCQPAVPGHSVFVTAASQPGSDGVSYVTATFTNCRAATGGGPLHPIWDYPNDALNMTSSSDTLASTSSLSNDGTQFTVTWHNGT